MEKLRAEISKGVMKSLEEVSIIGLNIQQANSELCSRRRTIDNLNAELEYERKCFSSTQARLTYAHKIIGILYNKLHDTKLTAWEVEKLFIESENKHLQKYGFSIINEECLEIPKAETEEEKILIAD